ncbi:MAG: hypothetical protein IT488_12830 [Gammaproteobacteria bacterium]|nr:hypothetical protein [Gammaproteobacteria bacterium]
MSDNYGGRGIRICQYWHAIAEISSPGSFLIKADSWPDDSGKDFLFININWLNYIMCRSFSVAACELELARRLLNLWWELNTGLKEHDPASVISRRR